MTTMQLAVRTAKSIRLLLFPTLVAAAVACGGEAREQAPDLGNCNVLLISIDTLRRDHMSLYGYHRDTTPGLDEFAKEAVVFDQAVKVSGGTLPNHMSMLTSLHPLVHGVTSESGRVLAESRTTLAEILKESGYSTAALTDGGWVRAKFGFHQGFDLYDDKGGYFKEILPKAYAWLDNNADSRFFLFLHTYDVHSAKDMLPYDSPDERYNRLYADGTEIDFDGCIDDLCASNLLQSINQQILNEGLDPGELIPDEVLDLMIDLYDGSINHVDDELAALFDHLRELGVYDNTLIIVTSDHGEEFLEHGFFLHRQGSFDEVARLPLIIKFPLSTMAGTRFQGMVSLVDLMPTVLDQLGLQGLPESNGMSLLPQLRDSVHARHDAVNASTLRTPKWKLLVESKELFNLEIDPSEQQNVFDQHPEETRYLMESWHEQVKELRTAGKALMAQDGAGASSPIELNQEDRESLRALGYVVE